MAARPASAESTHRTILVRLLASAAIVTLLPACTPSFMKGEAEAPALNLAEKPRKSLEPANPLHKATAYWAEQHRKNPNEPQAALNYARNLKAVGSKPLATSVLKQAHEKHPDHPEIASEFGRLLLEQGKTQLALRTLKRAELPGGRTDWRVVAAQGTAHAKLGDHAVAQKHFAAALKKKPDSASLRNNLALSYAMSGSPAKAETLLRQTIAGGYDNARVRQNLALALGMQGKYDEAQKLASIDLSKDAVEANVSYLRTLAKDKDGAGARLASQATIESAGPYRPATVRVASASASGARPSGKAEAPRQLTSRTRPLPWSAATEKAGGKPARVAEARSVPLPPRKPGGSSATPARTPESATAAAKAAPREQPVAVAAWSTRVIAGADRPGPAELRGKR